MYGGTMSHRIWRRRNSQRAPFDVACTAPCTIMAPDTGSSETRTPISSRPPAMPITPESTEVANTLMRMAVQTVNSFCLWNPNNPSRPGSKRRVHAGYS